MAASDRSSSPRLILPCKYIDLETTDLAVRRRSPRLMNGDSDNAAQMPRNKRQRSESTLNIDPNDVVKKASGSARKKTGLGSVSFFVGDPVDEEEARRSWPWRFENEGQQAKVQSRNSDYNEDELIINAKCHYLQAQIVNCIFTLGDCAYVKGEEGRPNYVGRIIEFFTTEDDENYFRVQWFFRAEDTVMKDEAKSLDARRLFSSVLMNDNPLDCIVSKVKLIQVPPNVNVKLNSIPPCDYYYDAEYLMDYSTFCTIKDNSNKTYSPACKDGVHINGMKQNYEEPYRRKPYNTELALLDVYSGCGGMSYGLCLGAKISGVDLVTRWAVDANRSACGTLKLNHRETQIRNESAEDFLDLLKEWDKLCKKYAKKSSKTGNGVLRSGPRASFCERIPSEEFEVASLVDICYGDPCKEGKRELKFQVRWVGYGPSEDTWESIDGLRKCQDHIQDFVLKGVKAKILPRPGDVDVVCGGPPCQGISGYNRHRNVDSPMDDERNRQIITFMDIVSFLKPKYVLMENVVDILRFAKGSLGRYALSRLVEMNYQTRLGIMAAGCYGLAQFRMRVFLWGARFCEQLPQFPLPTHDVVVRYGAPSEFERNIVAYDEGHRPDLEKALVLGDVISDLPPVTCHETREAISYVKRPENEFQRYIRAPQYEFFDTALHRERKIEKAILFDHRPDQLSEDDYLRVCQIPHRKGANFRDLPGVIVGNDNVARRDPKGESLLLPSGKHLVPDYAINLAEGKSMRPFARLWWDETVPTVLCKPDPHSQAVLHPEQDRVLTVRECARLQGFPDYFKFSGTIKDRYSQVGNAVAIPVARALGYSLGMAAQKLSGDGPLMTLPPKFAHSTPNQLAQSSLNNNIH